MFGMSRYARLVQMGRPASFIPVLLETVPDYWIWAALTPMVFWVARRYPFSHKNWPRILSINALFCVGFSVLHVIAADLIGLPGPAISDTLTRVGTRFVNEFYSDIWMYGPLVILWNLLDYQRRLRDREVRAARLEAELAKAQLELLRGQLQPHFLFNTLNTVSALIQEDAESAEDVLADLGYLLRASLECSATQEVPLRRELELTGTYLRIQTKRFEDRLSVEMDIPVETLGAIVPSFLLQPLVENALCHGIAKLSRPGHIRIAAHKSGGDLILTVADDGAGLRSGFDEGVGLANTRQRLYRLYGDLQHFELASNPNSGVTVTVRLPFQPAAAPNVETTHETADSDHRRRTLSPAANTKVALR